MRVLLVYPELPPSFWSLPQAIRFSSAKALVAPLAPLTVAALLPEEWEIRFVDCNVKKITEQDWDWADAVMISGMTVQRAGFQNIIKRGKERGLLTIVGGPFPSLMAEELLKYGCDIVFQGEIENTTHLLLEAIRSGKRGHIVLNDDKPDLTATPLPRYDLVNIHDYKGFLLQTARGCPYRCEFCDIAGLYGSRSRYKSPDQVIEELELLFLTGARGVILIADDNFIGNRKNAKAICEELIKWNRKHHQPFSFMTQASINLGQDMEMIDLMTAANFSEIFIGIESPEDDILIANEKHQNVRNPTLESVENIIKNGLSVIGSFILGFDNEKKGAGKRICEFADQSHIPTVMINLLSAVAGTKLLERLQKENRISDDMLQFHSGEFFINLPNFHPTRPLEEIIEEYVEAYEYLYEPRRFFERAYKFCLAIRPTRKATATANGTLAQDKTPPTIPPSLRRQFDDIIGFFAFSWKHGIVASHRWQYWKQLYGMRKRNPSRLKKYIVHCVSGDNLMALSKTIRNDMKLLMEARERLLAEHSSRVED